MDKLRQVFSPRDERLFPLRVVELHVAQGAEVAAGTTLMTLRTATGKTLVMRSPLAGGIAMIAAGAGDSIASPRALVTIAEATGPSPVETDPKDAPEEATPPPETRLADWEEDHGAPADARTREAEWEAEPARAGAAPADSPARKSAGAPFRATASARMPLVAALAVIAALGLGYLLLGPDHRATPQAPQRTSLVSPATSRPAPAARPASYSGPLSRETMLARDLDGRGAGWRSQGPLLGFGKLRLDKNGQVHTCPAVLIADSYALFPLICLFPTSTANQREEGAIAYFETIRPYRAKDTDGEWRDVPGYWHIWKLDVKGLHFWPEAIVEGTPLSIGVAELAEPAPGQIGFAGHWRITPTNAPAAIDLRNHSLHDPRRTYFEGATCRYWIDHDERRVDAANSLPLTVDSDCPGIDKLDSGAFEVRYSNGKDYLGGFFRVSEWASGPHITASTFSKSDDTVIRGAKEGKLPGGWITISPAERRKPRTAATILAINHCKNRTVDFNVIGTNTKSGDRALQTGQIAPDTALWMQTDMGDEYDRIAVTPATGRPGTGTKKFSLSSGTFHAPEFANKPGFELVVETDCD